MKQNHGLAHREYCFRSTYALTLFSNDFSPVENGTIFKLEPSGLAKQCDPRSDPHRLRRVMTSFSFNTVFTRFARRRILYIASFSQGPAGRIASAHFLFERRKQHPTHYHIEHRYGKWTKQCVECGIAGKRVQRSPRAFSFGHSLQRIWQSVG